MKPFKLSLHLLLLSIFLWSELFCFAGTAETSSHCVAQMESLLSRLTLIREQDPEYLNAYGDVLRLYKNDAKFFTWFKSEYRSEETPSQLLQRYFESPKPQPDPEVSKTIDLTNVDLLGRPHTGLCQICDAWVSRGILPREYTWRVMSLRKGDRVVFPGRQFLLGDFLGRGNAKHVWALEGQANEVLHIPFYAGPPKESVGRDSPQLFYFGPKPVRNFAEAYYWKEKTLKELHIPRVHVIEMGKDFSYLVGSRVKGVQNGREFLAKVWFAKDQHGLEEEEKFNLLKKRIFQYRAFAFQKLNRPLRSPYEPYQNEQDLLINEGRQFLYDGKEWILLDWD